MVNLITLSIYLFRLYCSYFISILLIIVGALVLSNIFDILQKFKTIHIPTHYFWQLATYKIPYLLNEISSLVSFTSMLFLLRRLTAHNELVAILCSGVHIWRVIITPVFAAIILGCIMLTILNPIGTIGLQKYEKLEAKLTNKESNDFIVSKSGLLFLEKDLDTKKILQVKIIDIHNSKLNHFTLLILDNNNNFLKRIDAPMAILSNNNIDISHAKIYDGKSFLEVEQIVVLTNLSINKLLDDFTNPEMISIWDLPDSIKQLVESGLPTLNYQIYYYKQLLKPIIMSVMVILASCFFSLKQRDNSQDRVLILGLFIGFIIYFILEISFKMLSYNNITPFLAILLPNIGILFISNYLIMHSKQI
ncbi:MAG: LptF/LptG family permease [Rickettsia endosymbiont of Bryobia graminum]|nr:LptF/LptG family permease [Rickettsia endosymbiont of Bryobia graminum]